MQADEGGADGGPVAKGAGATAPPEAPDANATVQAVKVLLQVGNPPVVQSEPFPDPVSHQEARVEDRDRGPIPWEKLSVDVDQDGGVPGVVVVAVRA